MNAKSQIRPQTVKIIAKILYPLSEFGIITVPEEREIISNLKHLSERGELIPNVMPKLIDQTEAAELLGISLANFKELEREEAFTFKRRMVGSSVRYRNLDVIKYLMEV